MKSPEQLRNEFWLEDKKNNSIIRKQYDEIKSVLETQNLEWVQKKYQEIKQFAIDNTEFYKNYSVCDDFPIVNKASILSSYEEHRAKDGSYQNPVHISSTSGSTGTPFSVYQDYVKRNRTIADLKVFGERCDYPSHERMVFFRGTTKNRTPEQEERENIFYVDCGNLGQKNLQKMTQVIIDKKPRIIFSYSSTLIELAKYIEKHNITNNFSMKAALIAGEGLSDCDRKFLERIFNCKIYRRYSDMELGILGQDMGDGGKYFLNYGSYYFECLKLDSDMPAAPGEIGRIVITDLFNKAMPMIRYDTGDYAIMEQEEHQFPVFREVLGKKMECVYSTAGELISPHKLEILMWGNKEIIQWQFIQDAKKEYHFNINATEHIDFTKIISDFKKYLGDDANITVQYVQEIPALASNKRRMVICNYNQDENI